MAIVIDHAIFYDSSDKVIAVVASHNEVDEYMIRYCEYFDVIHNGKLLRFKVEEETEEKFVLNQSKFEISKKYPIYFIDEV